MSESSQSPEQTPASQPTRARNWPLWLGLGFFGLVTIALLASLTNFWFEASTGSDQSAVGQDSAITETPPSGDGPTPAAPTDLRSHQQLVSEVVNDLDRAVLIGESPTRGNPDAEIVLLEFSDFQCPYCARATESVDAFVDAYESDVLYVYKNLPLANIHPEAIPAALAAWAAGQQGQFWAFHDALFARQDELGEALYEEVATDLGLNLEQFNQDRTSEAAQAAIARDLALASELQLRSTPTFIMDELLIPGVVPPEFFAEALARLQAANNPAE